MAKFIQGIVSEGVATSDPFTLESGYYLVAASANDGDTFPTSCQFQMRFKNSDGENVQWIDTDVVFDAPGADYILASENVEYRVVSSSDTVVFRVERTLIQDLNHRG